MTIIGKLLFGVRGARPTPVAAVLDDGTWIGHNGDGWLYMVMDRAPLVWADPKERMTHAAKLHALFVELGGLSRASTLPGTKMGADFREFHLISLAWDEKPVAPPAIHPKVVDWLGPSFERFSKGDALFAVGVKLRRASPFTASGFVGAIRSAIYESMSRVPDRNEFAADRALIGPILGRAGGQLPTDAEAARIETWWNYGRGADTTVIAEPDGRSISCDAWPEGLEFAALMEFQSPRLIPEHGMWLADCFGHHQGCVAVSVRGHLVPHTMARILGRKSQRKGKSRVIEQAETGDLDREEDRTLLFTSELIESLFVNSREPLVRDCSIVFARRATAAVEDYISMLDQSWGLKVKVLEYRQVEALEETLPLGTPRFGKSGPFAHDLTVGVLAASGLGAFNRIGDDEGVWIGTAPPDHSLVWLDPLGASKQNKPPAMAVIGEPGAGKTFLLQMIATQAALSGIPVVFINPKSSDSLGGFAQAVGGEVVTVSTTSDEPGLLDPFRYARTPDEAASIAQAHINTAMAGSLNEEQLILLKAGLRRGALNGALCVGEALKDTDIPERVRNLIRVNAENTPLFGLGVSMVPRESLTIASGSGLTLIEFDRELPVPPNTSVSASLTTEERNAVAAIRLICRAALEQMYKAGRGVLIIDEAHVFLGSQEGRSILQNLGRQGRSQGILPILATQRLADVVAEGVDMSSYLGRELIMMMTDRRETEAALTLCGLEVTDKRREFLANAGPIHDKDNPALSRGAFALHRDLQGNVSAIHIGPVTEDERMRYSTNYLDREARDGPRGALV